MQCPAWRARGVIPDNCDARSLSPAGALSLVAGESAVGCADPEHAAHNSAAHAHFPKLMAGILLAV
jgi:hypothetical protein